jgi:uncharacterized membrane protein YGL010W
MSKVHDLFDEYAQSHQNKANIIIHWFCVPIIFYCTSGILWCIPMPESFKSIGFPINLGTIGLVLAFIYYSLLSRILSYGMILVISGMISLQYSIINSYGTKIWIPYLIIFWVAWILQFIGHDKEGKKPAFMKDFQYLLVGPFYLLGKIYKKLRIGF